MKIKKITKRDSRQAEVRIYIWPKKETVMDNLVNRHSRPYKDWKPLAEEALAKVTNVAVKDNPYKIGWSQKAGCNCGCSPGFIVRGLREYYDIHVDVA